MQQSVSRPAVLKIFIWEWFHLQWCLGITSVVFFCSRLFILLLISGYLASSDVLICISKTNLECCPDHSPGAQRKQCCTWSESWCSSLPSTLEGQFYMVQWVRSCSQQTACASQRQPQQGWCYRGRHRWLHLSGSQCRWQWIHSCSSGSAGWVHKKNWLLE